MKTISRIALILVTVTATAAFAKEEPKDPTVKARTELMETVGQNMKVLGDVAGEKAAFDAAAATAAKDALAAAFAEVPAKFEPQATDPASEAKPEIWTNWDDFVSKATKAQEAAAAIDTSSLATLQAGVGAVGGACKACHTDYRM